MIRPKVTRRTVVKTAALAAAGTLAAPFVRGAHAAGKLSLGFWDHWVPASNPTMQKLVEQWAAKNKVEVTLDLLNTGTPNAKQTLAVAAESLSGTGHDVMTFLAWDVQHYHQHLTPLDDLMNAQVKKYGAVDPVPEYLAKIKGHWMAMPTSVGSQYKPTQARISWFLKAGYDVRKWYPAHPGDPKTAEAWTYDLVLKLAPAMKKDGMGCGFGLSHTNDCVDWTGALLRAYGAVLVDEKGHSQLRSEPVLQVLEYMQKLVPYLPDDAVVYDDASDNKVMIAGRSALIWDPPSPWYVARRDNPKVAADEWIFPKPAGPKGRYNAYVPFFWGVWSFSNNKSAAKDLILWLQQRPQVETLTEASYGYDIPPFNSMHDFKVWATDEPPPGVVYNYPIRPWHKCETSMACWPAPPHIATQMYSNGLFNDMIVKLAKQGEKLNDVLAWGEQQIENYANI